MATALGFAALTLGALRVVRARRYDVRGKVVLIAGASRGLGLQIAREAARRGAKLALLARSHVELDAARAELREAGATVETCVCDVRDDVQVRAAVEALTRALGPVDVLINVAGIITVGPVDALVFDDYRDAIETNYLGAVRTVEAVRASMAQRHTGRIVNVTSIGGRIAVPHLLPYSASKFALVGYSLGLRAELARDGIVVTTVVPGLMRTGSPPQATFAGRPPLEYALFAPADALPFTSVSIGAAARAVLRACERGSLEVVISPQAKAALALNRIAPRVVARLLATTARALPDAGGSTEHRYGHESETPLTRSPLDALGHAASVTQNELLDLKPSSSLLSGGAREGSEA